MQGKLKESPVEGPRTRVEPAIMVVSSLFHRNGTAKAVKQFANCSYIVKEERKSVSVEEKSGLTKVIGSV